MPSLNELLKHENEFLEYEWLKSNIKSYFKIESSWDQDTLKIDPKFAKLTLSC